MHRFRAVLSRIGPLGFLLLIIVAVPITVFLAKQVQDVRQRASGPSGTFAGRRETPQDGVCNNPAIVQLGPLQGGVSNTNINGYVYDTRRDQNNGIFTVYIPDGPFARGGDFDQQEAINSAKYVDWQARHQPNNPGDAGYAKDELNITGFAATFLKVRGEAGYDRLYDFTGDCVVDERDIDGLQAAGVSVPRGGQQAAVPATVTMSNGATQFGMQVDLRESNKVPSSSMLATLNPSWVRYVWADNIDRSTLGTTRQLVIVNQETAIGAPMGSTDVAAWKTYVDTIYLPKLTSVLGNGNITAIEIWNEEDFCVSGYCPGMPAAAYGYLLRKAAETIKTTNGSIQVVMGGMASGQISYITDMLAAEPTALSQVDAVGLHPYGKSPGGWEATSFPFGDMATSIQEFRSVSQGKPIWITEIGYGDSTSFQGEYLTRSFQVFEANAIPVAIWYAWIDYMGGNNGQNNWGLVGTNNQLKPGGNAFTAFTNPAVTTPTAVPTVGPSPTLPPPPSVTPIPSGTPPTEAPTAAPTTTISPTAIPSPTPCSSCILFTMSLKLPGIGTGQGENTSPKHPAREIRFTLVDTKNEEVPPVRIGTMIYNAATGLFAASVDMGQSIQPGVYGLFAQSPGTLKKRAVNILTITSGQTVYPFSEQPTLIVGNISDDNKIDIEDYNLFISCFGDKKTNTPTCDNADITDDGVVDLLDYKYFIQMFQTLRGD